LRRGDVDIDLVAASAEQPAAPCQHSQHNYDDKDYEHRNYAGTAAAIAIVGHTNSSEGSYLFSCAKGVLKKGITSLEVLTQHAARNQLRHGNVTKEESR